VPADLHSAKSRSVERKSDAVWAGTAAAAEDRPPARSAASSSDDRLRMPGLGARLRAQRLAAHMSLRQLARTLGVSASFVSQIENDKSQPSVATLYQICQVIDLSVDELFVAATAGDDGGSASTEKVRRDELNLASSSSVPSVVSTTIVHSTDGRLPVVSPSERPVLVLDSGVTWEKMSPASEPGVDFMYVRYDVGGSSGPHGLVTRHKGMEYGYIIKGTLEVTLGFETYIVGPQQSISFDSSTPHRLMNKGQEPVEAVWFVHR
jgi:transcriptional regulator with XRE-family HTH domain/mannose-6-phosphate isomerase-like protein (cupin superfamily)